MAALSNPKYELFAALVAKGVSPEKAYTSVGYAKAGARQSASKLLQNTAILLRVTELTGVIVAGVIHSEICDRNSRVAALQQRVDLMRRVISERGSAPEYLMAPGGTTGTLCRDFRGKNAEQEVFKFDAALMRELRAHEQQAAIELGQWEEKMTMSGEIAISEDARKIATLQAGRERARRSE